MAPPRTRGTGRLLESELKERKALEATLVAVAVLQRVQVESALEAKMHELTWVSERIPSLEVAVAKKESQILNARTEAQAVLAKFAKATYLADLTFTLDGNCDQLLFVGYAKGLCRLCKCGNSYCWAVPYYRGSLGTWSRRC